MAWPCVGAAGQDCRQQRFLSAIKKLHKALADPRFVPTVEDNVDMLVCGKYRPILEQEFDVRFAEQLYAQMRKHVSFDDAAAAFRVALKQPMLMRFSVCASSSPPRTTAGSFKPNTALKFGMATSRSGDLPRRAQSS
jgi:hypothetical protein